MRLPNVKPGLAKSVRVHPATVLVDPSFVEALVDDASARHAAAVAIYRRLVVQYRSEQVLLVATSLSLHAVPRHTRRSLLAPIAGVHVARRYRRAARRITAIDFIDAEFAALLVLLRREKISRVASFDPRFTAIDIELEQDVGMTEISLAGGDDQSNAA